LRTGIEGAGEHGAAVKTEPEPSADDAEIKRLKAAADIEIAQWKARQWAEIERFKAGLKAELLTVGAGADGPERSRGVSS
jgi:hypothetical protein